MQSRLPSTRVLPLPLRVLSAALAAAASRVGLAATSHALRQTLGTAYTARLLPPLSWAACVATLLLVRATRLPPARTGGAAAAAFVFLAGAGLQRAAAAAVCAAGSAVAAAAASEDGGFVSAAVAVLVAVAARPVVEVPRWGDAVLARGAGVVLMALAVGYVGCGEGLDGDGDGDGVVGKEGRRRRSPARRGRGSVFVGLRRRCGKGGVGAAGLLGCVAVGSAVSAVGLLSLAGSAVREALLRPAMPPGYVLLDQAHGVTGLVSVVEDRARGFRFLTADHSVLGGMYIGEAVYGENIFGQFHVHEAVRLTLRPGEERRAGGVEGRALCIGLGVGVVARALATLGCAVDAVEIDGVVVDYAQRYFDFGGQDAPVKVHVEDALVFLERTRKEVAAGEREPWDYVIHDVFTGGSVPLALFSVDVFHGIAEVLSEDGVLAINFVGMTEIGGKDSSVSPREAAAAVAAVSAVSARLSAAFAYSRAFSDDNGGDIHNIVLFASNAASRMEFAEPTARDILGSTVREDTLKSFMNYQVPADVLDSMPLRKATDEVLGGGQWVTAVAHWRVMREVFTHQLWPAIAG